LGILYVWMMTQKPRWLWRLPLQTTGGDHQGVLVSCGWTPSSAIWEPTTSHWTKQSTWPRTESLQPHTERSSRPGSAPSSVEADVYVCRYTLLVVHAGKEEKEENTRWKKHRSITRVTKVSWSVWFWEEIKISAKVSKPKLLVSFSRVWSLLKNTQNMQLFCYFAIADNEFSICACKQKPQPASTKRWNSTAKMGWRAYTMFALLTAVQLHSGVCTCCWLFEVRN